MTLRDHGIHVGAVGWEAALLVPDLLHHCLLPGHRLLIAGHDLGKLDSAKRKAVLDAFLRAALTAVPGARKNSMNAATLPHAVLGIRKDKGQPSSSLMPSKKV